MPKVTSPEDIPKLPWKGNYRDDAHLLEACSEYVRHEPNVAKQYLAERYAHWHGMGMKLPEVPSADALEYLTEMHKERK